MNNLNFLSEIILEVINAEDSDIRINAMLKKIAEHTQVSRIYIFWDSKEGATTSNVFEWCATGITPQMDKLQNIPYAVIPSWKKILNKEGRIYSESIRELPADLVSILEPQGILSLLVYPLTLDSKICGFIGFDECKNNRKWQETEINLLKILSGIISAICERRIMKKQFKQEQINYETFLNTIDDLLVIGNKEGEIIHVNNSVLHKTGYSLEELKKMKVIELHPEDKREEALVILNQMFTGERDSCPLELGRKDKSRFPVETRVWFGKWDEQDCIFGLSKDLGKEQETLQLFTKFFEHNPASMAITSVPERKFIRVNSAFVEKTGYSAKEILGKTSIELGLFVNPGQKETLTNEVNKTLSVKDKEIQIRRKDGSILDGVFSGEIIENQGRKELLTILLDVTEKKRSEEKLKKEVKIFTDALLESSDAIAICRLKDGVYTDVNKAFSLLTGYTPEEAYSASEKINVNMWKDPLGLKHLMSDLDKGFEKKNMKMEMLDKDGESKKVEVSVRRIELNDESNLLIMIKDNTKLLSVEEQLLHNVKMQAVGTLTAGIAHDFNNMLGIIIGYSEISLKIVGEDERLANNIKQINQAAAKAANLTAQLLAFSRKQPVKYEILSVNDSVSGIKKMLERIIGENIVLETFLIPGLQTIYSDKGRLDQILINLVTNAVHAMPNGGKISIKTENIKLDEKTSKNIDHSRPGEFVCLSVLDTGVGISPEQFKHLFEPFYTTKPAGKGTGLGLPVIYDIVNKQKGWINIDSTAGKGAEFKLYFPATNVKPGAVSQEKILETSKVIKCNKILMVEDEKELCELIRVFLEGTGFKVFSVANAEEALKILEEEKGKIDLLFTDSVLPGLSGLALAEKVKALTPGIKVLISSGFHDDKTDMAKIKKQGWSFLPKPYGTEKLLSEIIKVLGK